MDAPICQPQREVASNIMATVDELLGLDNPAATVQYPAAIILWRGPWKAHRDPKRRARIVISHDRTPAPNSNALLKKAQELAALQEWGAVPYHYYICTADDQDSRCRQLHDCLCTTFETLLAAAA